MTTISDLFRLQQATDVLITRAMIARLGHATTRPPNPTTEQMTSLYRLQVIANDRLLSLVKQMEEENDNKENRTEADSPELSSQERGRDNG